MKTGFSRNTITPSIGVPICGYYERRITKGVLDELYVSAVGFEDGGVKAVIIAVDVCLLSTEQCNYARRVVAEACGIDERAVFINCSHTHTGPIVGTKKNAFQDGDREYDEFFYATVAKTAKESFADMKESFLSVGTGKAERISFIRRFRMKDGGVQTNPGVDNPNIDHALGTPNDTVKVLKVKGNIGYGKAEEILTPAEERVRPKCPVFSKCGGCCL